MLVCRFSDAPAARSFGEAYGCSLRRLAQLGGESFPWGNAQPDGTRKYPWLRSDAARLPLFLTARGPGHVIDCPAATGLGVTDPRSAVADVVIKSSGAGASARTQPAVPGTQFFSPTTTVGGFFSGLNVAKSGMGVQEVDSPGAHVPAFLNTRSVTLY